MLNTIVHGDCLDVMKDIPDNSIDMILADLPYGTTQCKWDEIIPFSPLWAQYKRIAKPSAGRELVAVNPAYTSQDCSRCGYRQIMPLSERVYKCPECGLEIGRDVNAALNILAHGLVSIGTQSVEAESSA